MKLGLFSIPETKIYNLQEYLDYQPITINDTEYITPELFSEMSLSDPQLNDSLKLGQEIGYQETNVTEKLRCLMVLNLSNI